MGRRGYIDWLRGLAVVIMIQAHAIDAWVAPGERQGRLFHLCRLLGGLPAPLFLFLAGLSLALVTARGEQKGSGRADLLRAGVARGVEVLGWAFLFRLWFFATSGFAKPANLLRVDVLNCIGVSMTLTALVGIAGRSRVSRLLPPLLLATLASGLAPYVWHVLWAERSAHPALGYLSGSVAGAPFPLLPWGGFTAVGFIAGSLLAWTSRERRLLLLLGCNGAILVGAGLALGSIPGIDPYGDFWWTSPRHFAIRCGLLLLLLAVAAAWERAPWGRWPSALRQMGRTSLLIYWVHIEIVYGVALAGFLRRRLTPLGALGGAAVVGLAMLGLSLWRTRSRRRSGLPPTTATPLAVTVS